MKSTTARSVLLSVGLLAVGVWLGVRWATAAVGPLNGLRSASPVTHEEEAAFIRSRVSFPIVPPEWVSGIELDPLAWLKYEMLARCALTIVASVAAAAIVGPLLRRKNEKPA